jgi:hypothetical protein
MRMNNDILQSAFFEIILNYTKGDICEI